MSIEINPCNDCIKKYQNGNCDIRNVSDCCYSTLAAFAGETSMNAVRNGNESDDKGLQNCLECTQQFIKGMGRTPCDLRVEPPPLWNRTPHYFPELLKRNNMDYDMAKKICMDECKNTRFPNECMSNCETDYNAVEKFKTHKSVSFADQLEQNSDSNNNVNNTHTTNTENVDNSKQTKDKEHKVTREDIKIISLICAILISILIYTHCKING